MKHAVFFLLVIALIAAMPFAGARAMDTTARQAYVIDYDTGQVLLEKSADERMPTSSMSKVMTVYVIFDLLKKGQLNLDQEFNVSEKAWRMQGSKMFVEVGKKIKVRDLLQGVIVQSGNDATIVLAEGIAGSEEAFVEMMNARAAELGMKDTHFDNASGWPDPNHYSTAHDLAILARAIIHDFPEDYKYFSEKEFTYHGIKQGNRNPLLYKDIGADGLKTGHTEAGGFGLIGTGVQNGRRVIMVLNGLATSNDRATEGANILDWALKSFENKTLVKPGQVVDKARVVMGKQENVPLVTKEGLFVTIPRAAAANYKVVANYKEPLEAPIKAGQQVGTLAIEIPQSEPMTIPLYAGRDVDRLGFFSGALIKLMMMAGGS